MTQGSSSRPPADTKERQAPLMLIALAAVGAIWAIHLVAGPPLSVADTRLQGASGCGSCGTVVGIRRSAHSVPQTLIEVQMADGSTRTVRSPGAAVSVGDVVELRGDDLTPRDVF